MGNLGMVHGRFQPFHNEHLEYVLSGLKRCKRLIIGITNPEPSEFKFKKSSNHRHLVESNPFTFFQRMEMIKQALTDLNIDLKLVSVVPLYLFDHLKWEFYLPNPNITTQYVRVFSSWERKKIETFKSYGFKVEIIDKGVKKNMTGTLVRKLIGSDDDWERYVPNATSRIIKKIKQGTF